MNKLSSHINKFVTVKGGKNNIQCRVIGHKIVSGHILIEVVNQYSSSWYFYHNDVILSVINKPKYLK